MQMNLEWVLPKGIERGPGYPYYLYLERTDAPLVGLFNSFWAQRGRSLSGVVRVSWLAPAGKFLEASREAPD